MLDFLRIVAACFVVFIHFCLPGSIGIAMRGIARFAVPFFFMVTGFYCKDILVSRVPGKMSSILRIATVSCLLYLVWGCLRSKLTGVGITNYLLNTFTLQKIAQWVFLNECPLVGHLWYLFAIATVYLLLVVSAVLSGKDNVDIRSLYFLGAAAFLVLVVFDLFGNGSGMKVDFRVYRNGLVMGLPMFLLGDIMRRRFESEDPWAFSDVRKAALVAMIGVPLTLLQEFGIGKSELPIGSVLTALGLVSLAISCPCPRFLASPIVSSTPFAEASLAIYAIHPMVGQVLRAIVEPYRSMGEGPSASFTMAVLGISVVLGFLYAALVYAFRKRRKCKVATTRV